MTREKHKYCRAIYLASCWHGGGGSAFYSFASTRTIHSAKHRKSVLVELGECEKYTVDKRDDRNLAFLRGVIESAPLRKELVTLAEQDEWSDKHG